MQASQPGCSLMLLAVLSAALASQVGCVQRNLEFNCKAVVPNASLEGANASLDTRAPQAESALVGSASSDASEAEMEMSPTKLRFKGIAYGFREEAGAWRIYEASESKARLRFNPVSGELLLVDEAWSCRRYEALLEKARP